MSNLTFVKANSEGADNIMCLRANNLCINIQHCIGTGYTLFSSSKLQNCIKTDWFKSKVVVYLQYRLSLMFRLLKLRDQYLAAGVMN